MRGTEGVRSVIGGRFVEPPPLDPYKQDFLLQDREVEEGKKRRRRKQYEGTVFTVKCTERNANEKPEKASILPLFRILFQLAKPQGRSLLAPRDVDIRCLCYGWGTQRRGPPLLVVPISPAAFLDSIKQGPHGHMLSLWYFRTHIRIFFLRSLPPLCLFLPPRPPFFPPSRRRKHTRGKALLSTPACRGCEDERTRKTKSR